MNIASNGIDLHLLDTGPTPGAAGPALVFLHYWGGSSLEWAEVVATLSPRHRCIALDARGAGDSEAPATGYGSADLADDVQGVVAALGLADFVLVGHSMGGKTAQVLAARRPAGLRGLVLVASAPPVPVIDDAQRAQMRGAYASRESVEWVLDNVLASSPTSDAARDQAIVDALRLSPQATAGWIDAMSREDVSATVARIDVPVVAIAGELDRVDPLDVVRRHLLSHFAAPALHLLPGKGHLLPLEAPAEVAAIVDGFVATL